MLRYCIVAMLVASLSAGCGKKEEAAPAAAPAGAPASPIEAVHDTPGTDVPAQKKNNSLGH